LPPWASCVGWRRRRVNQTPRFARRPYLWRVWREKGLGLVSKIGLGSWETGDARHVHHAAWAVRCSGCKKAQWWYLFGRSKANHHESRAVAWVKVKPASATGHHHADGASLGQALIKYHTFPPLRTQHIHSEKAWCRSQPAGQELSDPQSPKQAPTPLAFFFLLHLPTLA
jgi:hypothetical protein